MLIIFIPKPDYKHVYCAFKIQITRKKLSFSPGKKKTPNASIHQLSLLFLGLFNIFFFFFILFSFFPCFIIIKYIYVVPCTNCTFYMYLCQSTAIHSYCIQIKRCLHNQAGDVYCSSVTIQWYSYSHSFWPQNTSLCGARKLNANESEKNENYFLFFSFCYSTLSLLFAFNKFILLAPQGCVLCGQMICVIRNKFFFFFIIIYLFESIV